MGGRGIPREGPDHLWDSNPKLGVPKRGSSLPAITANWDISLHQIYRLRGRERMRWCHLNGRGGDGESTKLGKWFDPFEVTVKVFLLTNKVRRGKYEVSCCNNTYRVSISHLFHLEWVDADHFCRFSSLLVWSNSAWGSVGLKTL